MARKKQHSSRTTKQKADTTAFCFVVEGHTEADYLAITLNVQKPNIIDNADCTDPLNLVKVGIKHLDGEAGFETVFVVFDKDDLKANSNTVAKIESQLKDADNRVKVIFSNACFEYLLGLHFEPTKHPPNINSKTHMAQYGYPNHKNDPMRTKLMTDLKKAPDKCRAMYTALKSREKTLQFNACTHWVERVKPENDPNSNFYVVYDYLASHTFLPFPLSSSSE